MIYLDNAATSLSKPKEVGDAMLGALCLGNPARGAHGASIAALRVLTEARMAVAGLFYADSACVCFTKNATEALNIAIGGIEGHIVTTAAEHNSVLRPLYRRGSFSVAPVDSFGRLDLTDIENEIKADTKAVVITHASNLTGNVFDLLAVGELCKKKGLRLVVDGAQTAGLLPIDMKKIGISALCISGHKSLFGPSGIGALCLGEGFFPPPIVAGGSGTDSFSTSHSRTLPGALEAGTQNTVGAAGLAAGIDYVNGLGSRAFLDADRLARIFTERVRGIKGVTLYGDHSAALRMPIVTLNLGGMDAGELSAVLFERYDIAARGGAHCAPLMHKAQGTTSAARFSFSHLNTDGEVQTVLLALNEIAKTL